MQALNVRYFYIFERIHIFKFDYFLYEDIKKFDKFLSIIHIG